MPDPLDLVSLVVATQHLKNLGLTSPPDLTAIITGVSVAMQNYASRNFGQQTYNATLNGQGSDRLSLPNTPITEVSSLSIDGVTVPASPGPTQAGYVFSDSQVLLRGYRFCRGVQNVGLTYTAGFIDIPADLQRAACEGISALVAMFDYSDPRVVELSAGGTKIKLGALTSRDYARFCLTTNVTDVLEQLKRVTPC